MVARPFSGGTLCLILGDLLSEKVVLGAELFVLFLETFGDVLEGDVAFDLALLILLHTSLELGELRLLSLAKGALCSPINGVQNVAVLYGTCKIPVLHATSF